jgi:serine/threonine-protein kinase
MPSDYAPNQIIPGTVYQVIRTLGSAGLGSVYEVEDTTIGKHYVLKTLHADVRDRAELALRMQNEARVLARLSHVNIVEVVTAGATSDDLRLPYIVMQMLNGHTLRAIIAAKGSLPLPTALSIAIDLLDALDHAHAHGVVHRDVKPENVFIHRNVSGATVTKLLDFGVMRLLTSDTGITGHRFVGSLRYAPPEQLRGHAITPRTDLYTAALVLYEMVAGSGPFDDAPSDRDVASAHLDKEPPRLSQRATVPVALCDLIASALSKDPAMRPRDAFTFAARLREIAREVPHTAGATAAAGIAAALGDVPEPPEVTNVTDASSRTRTGSLEVDGQSTMRGMVRSAYTPRPRSYLPAFAAATVVLGLATAAAGIVVMRRQSPAAPTAAELPAIPDSPAASPRAPALPPMTLAPSAPPAAATAASAAPSAPVIASPVIASPVIASPVIAKPAVAKPHHAPPVAHPKTRAAPPKIAAPKTPDPRRAPKPDF